MAAAVAILVLVLVVAAAAGLRQGLWARRHHQAGVAYVIACGPLSGRPGDAWLRAEVDLQVELPHHPPYRTVTRLLVPADRVADLEPGAELPVRADAADPQQVSVRWKALPAP